MTMMLMCCEAVIKNEIEQGLRQKDIALTYAMAMHSEDHGRPTNWKEINEAIVAKWGDRGLSRVKNLAHGIYERRGVDPWDVTRDAREYEGPHPVVAHPPCQRWGRFWHGSTRKPHQFALGDDGGCFAAALEAVRLWGGVLEHPCDSHAWKHFGLKPPKRFKGWQAAGDGVGWTCYVEQGHYGHMSRKPTWLYAAHVELPELNWSKGEQRLHPTALARYGYEKARSIGMMAMVGGKDKTKIRNATPTVFRDVLLSMAHSTVAFAKFEAV